MTHASKKRRLRQCSKSHHLEMLESRTLMSVTIGGITIPGIPSLPGGVTIPSLTNQLDLGSLSSFLEHNPNDDWWLSNTGQTLSNPMSGPATGTPGADINALGAWNITTGSSNVVVAVLDTGIDLNNTALAASLWTNPGEIAGDGIDNDGNGVVDDVHGWNFLDNNNNLQDNFVHGTAVAATILSVAPGVSILPVEIGTAGGVNDGALLAGINYLIALKQAGVNIVAINASYISFTPPTSDEVAAIKNAGDNGMLYIAAAGNAGLNLDTLIPDIPASLAKYIPQLLPSNLIFVAATDNQDNLASFSDYGARTVAVGAPGVDITLPIPGGLYAPLSGTSFAAPMVSGIAALLKSRFPAASLGQIKSAILNSGDLDPSLAGKTVTGRRVDALKALNYMMGNKTPTGSVDVLNNTTISGWAFDPNLGAAPATVKITMDGRTLLVTSAGNTRDDLAAVLGSSDHGFSVDVSSLIPYGKHKMQVWVADDATRKFKLIGQGKVIVNTLPIGSLESADARTIRGWAFDSDVPTRPIQVKYFVDGRSANTTTARVARPDLLGTLPTANHGFAAKLPSLRAGIHRVDAYAIDPLTKQLTLIGSLTVSSNRRATGMVEVLNNSVLSGWAFDPDAGSRPSLIQYQIDDFAPVLVSANAVRPDLQKSLGSRNHGFNIALPQLTTGDHTITVNAVDFNTRSLTQLISQTLTVTETPENPLPTGDITITGTQVSGTVADGDSTAPINVRIDIELSKGSPYSFVTTAYADPDTGVHTFTADLPVGSPLLAGPRHVYVYALDDQTSTPVLLNNQLINYVAPTATVESLTSAGASGYAVAPNAAGGVALLRLDIDGQDGALVAANLSRPDLADALGRSNVGFYIPIQQIAPGTHVATLYLLDPVTLVNTKLGEITFDT